MTYTEKELDQFLHGISLSLLSKKSAQHWRYDEETAKEIEWLEALERKVRADKADHKTESDLENPNNCETCGTPKHLCQYCIAEDRMWTPKTEPQTWTKENCKGCKYNEYPYDSGTCFVRVCINGNKYEPKTEPQTETDLILEWSCSFSDCDNFENFGLNERCVKCKHMQRKATEPQTERSE